MIIHVVQSGETVNDIAKKYGVSVERLIIENGIQNPNKLVEGETLVILIPKITHIIQEGESLAEIADSYNISILQILRNNPYLANKEYIYPGERIVISYECEKVGKLFTYGYAYPFIHTDVLRMTLPFLTYITVYTYTFTADGKIDDIDDKEIIELSKKYNVAPLMMLNADDINQDRISNTMQKFLLNKKSQEVFFDNVMNILSSKGYYGVNLNIPYILPYNRAYFVNFMLKFSNLLKSNGYTFIFNTLSFSTFEVVTGIVYEGFDHIQLLENVNGVLLMTYEWGNITEIPIGIIAFDKIRQFVDESAEKYTPKKIYLGIPILGYRWELPYVIGATKGLAISYNAAVELAGNVGAVIRYDDISKTAYYQYTFDREYVVRIRDARTIDEYLNLVKEVGLEGVSIWNIMQFFPQLWLLINSLYDVNNIFDNYEK